MCVHTHISTNALFENIITVFIEIINRIFTETLYIFILVKRVNKMSTFFKCICSEVSTIFANGIRKKTIYARDIVTHKIM